MKNTFKILGIIALAAVIGFSMVACSDDDALSGDGDYFASELLGTWKGDAENGTLIIEKDGISTPEGQDSCKADNVAFMVSGAIVNTLMGGTFTAKDGKISLTSSGVEIVYYKYTINGKTLTLTNEDGTEEEFKGDKQ